MEEDVGAAHDVEVDDTTAGNEVGQPGQNLVGSTADLQEGQAWECHNDAEAPERDTVLGAVAKDLRSATLKSQTVQTTGGAVGVGVAGTEDGGAHQGIHDVWQDTDAQVLHGNDIGRGSSRLLASLLNISQGRVVVGDDDTGTQGTEDEEKTKTVVDSLEGILDVDARTLSLCGDHGDVLRTDNTESGAPHASEETFKSANASS